MYQRMTNAMLARAIPSPDQIAAPQRTAQQTAAAVATSAGTAQAQAAELTAIRKGIDRLDERVANALSGSLSLFATVG